MSDEWMKSLARSLDAALRLNDRLRARLADREKRIKAARRHARELMTGTLTRAEAQGRILDALNGKGKR